MSRSGLLAISFVVLLAATPGLTARQAATQKPADQPTFRSVVTMVPIDVRVLDSKGDPITDLTAGDFTIIENGQRQQIRHFSTMALTAETHEPGTTPAFEQVLGPRSGTLTPQNRRVFLILLGRGRVIGPPVKEIEALVDFVGTRLLPQDLVAVQAYNRATPFTSNHAAVAQLLAQFLEHNGLIERDLEHWFSGLRVITGSPGIPPHIQQQIDGLFASVPALAARNTLARPADQIDRDIRATAANLLRGTELAARPEVNGQPASLPDGVATAALEQIDMTLDEYAVQQSNVRQDTTGLFAGINYLRQLGGEKHLVFVTPTGISLPRMEQNQSLAAVAADGRVALSIIFTGGPAVAPRPVDMGPSRAMGIQMQAPFASASRAFRQTFTIADLREMTEITGGQLSVYQNGSEAVDRIDRATRFNYLLGYTSSNATLDGRFRDISIRVNRRGATVLHRRGYFASERLLPMNRREFMTATRIAEAGAYERDLEDIVVNVKRTAVEGRGDSRHLVVELQIRAPKIRLTEQDDRRVGAIELALFVADGRQRGIGHLRQTIDVRLRPESVERFLADGTTLTTHVPFDGEALYLKVIAYDYGADLVGTATRVLR